MKPSMPFPQARICPNRGLGFLLGTRREAEIRVRRLPVVCRKALAERQTGIHVGRVTMQNWETPSGSSSTVTHSSAEMRDRIVVRTRGLPGAAP